MHARTRREKTFGEKEVRIELGRTEQYMDRATTDDCSGGRTEAQKRGLANKKAVEAILHWLYVHAASLQKQ